MNYLQQFYEKLRKWEGGLVKVETVKSIEPNAKEYLNKLSKEGKIERVVWGWYWIPDEIKDVWDFLAKDKNFKIISIQTAASFWNYDFIHRDVCVLKVTNSSYGKALIEFCKKRGWNVVVKRIKPSEVKFTKIGNLFVETIEDTIIECIKNWAFMDAFATLYVNREKINLGSLYNKVYWKRISGTNIRIGQALKYGCYKTNELIKKSLFPVKGKKLKDEFIRREIDEAIERVVELG